MSATRMATRDASWYARPNVREPKAFHVVSGDFVAACNSRVLLVEETASSVTSVHLRVRCQRAACRNRWVQETDQ